MQGIIFFEALQSAVKKNLDIFFSKIFSENVGMS